MNIQLFTDKLAISLSTICVLHCLFMPSFLILSSWFVSFSLNNEFVHYSILFAAVPVSTYALMKGYLNHEKLSYLLFRISGLLVLVFAVLTTSIFGEIGEKSLTVLGSLFVIYAHYKNHQIMPEAKFPHHSHRVRWLLRCLS